MSSEKRSLLQSFMSSSVGTIVSKAFGLLRELVLSGVLGAGMVKFQGVPILSKRIVPLTQTAC